MKLITIPSETHSAIILQFGNLQTLIVSIYGLKYFNTSFIIEKKKKKENSVKNVEL